MGQDEVSERGVLTASDELWETAVRQAGVISRLAALDSAGVPAVDAAADELGGVEATDGWFNPGEDGDADVSDVLAALEKQRMAADAFLVGRQTFEEMRGCRPWHAERLRDYGAASVVEPVDLDAGPGAIGGPFDVVENHVRLAPEGLGKLTAYVTDGGVVVSSAGPVPAGQGALGACGRRMGDTQRCRPL